MYEIQSLPTLNECKFDSVDERPSKNKYGSSNILQSTRLYKTKTIDDCDLKDRTR